MNFLNSYRPISFKRKAAVILLTISNYKQKIMKSFIAIAMVQALVASQETGLECGDKIVKIGAREVEFSRIEAEIEHDIATCFFSPDFVQCLTTEAMLDQICSSHHYDPVTNTIDGMGEWCQDRNRALRDYNDLQYFFDH